MASEKQPRKLWSEASMAAAYHGIMENIESLREMCALYNVPIETLRRRVNGSVALNCRPGQ